MGGTDPNRAWAIVEAYVDRQRGAIAELGPRVLAEEPDAVHKLRVACRRLRGTTRTFRPYTDEATARRLEGELRWLALELGRWRDTEVMAARLRDTLSAPSAELIVGDVRDRIEARMGAEYAIARDVAFAALRDERYAALPTMIDEFSASAPAVDIDEAALCKRVRKAVRRFDGRLSTVVTARPGEARAVALHSARKAGKRARYAVEAVRELGGEPANRLGEALKRLQDVLGAHQDAVTAQRLLRELARTAEETGESAFTYGLLYAHEEAAAERALDLLPAAQQGFSDPAVRAWLVR